MGRYQREKGARAERLFRDLCREHGFTAAKRGGQAMYQRGSELADVIGLPGIHIEVKAVERLNVRKAMEQSQRDATDEKEGNLPIVAHKANRKPWLVTMLADDWFRLYRGWKFIPF